MKKIDEKEVSKITYLNGKGWKKFLIILTILILIIAIAISVWGWGFKGFLYLEMKRITNEYYTNLIVNLNDNYEVNESEEIKQLIKLIQDDIKDYYEIDEKSFKFTNLYEVETLKSSQKMIYAVSQNIMIQDHRLSQRKINSSTFFIYEINSKKLIDLLFWTDDLDRLESYQ